MVGDAGLLSSRRALPGSEVKEENKAISRSFAIATRAARLYTARLRYRSYVGSGPPKK